MVRTVNENKRPTIGMTDSEPQQPGSARRDALVGISSGLTALAEKFRARATSGQKLATLTDGAAAIALQAREVYSSRFAFQSNASHLASSLMAFSAAAADASAKAGEEARGTLAAVDVLVSFADRIAKLGDPAGAPATLTTLKAELEPLESMLTELHSQVQSGNSLVEDAAKLSNRAGEIAKLAERLHGGGRDAESAALAVTGAMTALMGEITAVANRYASVSGQASDVAGRLAATMRERNDTPPATAPQQKPQARPTWSGVTGGRS